MNTEDNKSGEDSKKVRKNKTRLNKAYRIDAGVNSRRYGDGAPIEVSAFLDDNDNVVVRYIDQETHGGGNVTPFNILCNCSGACAIKQIIFDEDETIVLFVDGDRVSVHRHSEDSDDRVAAVLWAIAEKVFGEDVSRQIKRAIKYRGVERAKLREIKETKKSFDKSLD